MARGLIVGIGTASALVVAATGYYFSSNQPNGEARTNSEGRPGPECVSARIKLVDGMTGNCMTAAQFESLRDRPVIDGAGETVIVNLSAPDAAKDAVAVRTCAEYDSMTSDGWYALTGADLRRAAYFNRACGALSMLVKGRLPRESNFTGGEANESEIRSLAEGDAIEFGEAGPSAPVGIESVAGGVWRITIGQGETMIYEIAHADFTGDGVGEILAYLTTGVAGGAAHAGTIGLIEKSSADGPCTFIPH